MRLSHPLGVRELKPHSHRFGVVFGVSHPLGVRELKLALRVWRFGARGSHPLGVRELKPLLTSLSSHDLPVAPFRGA